MSRLDDHFLETDGFDKIPYIQVDENRQVSNSARSPEVAPSSPFGRLARRLLVSVIGVSASFGIVEVTAVPPPAEATAGAPVSSKDNISYHLFNIRNNTGGYLVRCEINFDDVTGSTEYPALADELVEAFKNAPNSGYTDKKRDDAQNYFEGGLRASGRGFEPKSSNCFTDGRIKVKKKHPRAETAGRMTRNAGVNAKATAETLNRLADPLKPTAKELARIVAGCPNGWRIGYGCKGNLFPNGFNPWAELGFIPDAAKNAYVKQYTSENNDGNVMECLILAGDDNSTNYDDLGLSIAKSRQAATNSNNYSEVVAHDVSEELRHISGGYDSSSAGCYIVKVA